MFLQILNLIKARIANGFAIPASWAVGTPPIEEQGKILYLDGIS